MITGYIVERCEDGTDKWLRCNARLCPDLFYKVDQLKNYKTSFLIIVVKLHTVKKKQFLIQFVFNFSFCFRS